MQVKLREVVHCEKQIVYGFTVPNEIAIFFKQCIFNVEKSGCSIIFTSGCSNVPTKEQIRSYKFEDIRL